jgi:molybdopterin/thiamine biosynthesis adenylyltransferase
MPNAQRPTPNSRYSRQLVLPQIGEEGQRRLLGARITVIGCGATGTVVANHLARAGVGRLRIVDRDWVELNNLQRQLLFDEADVAEGLPKAKAAERRLRAVNSEIEIEGVVSDVHAANVEGLIADADLVMDGTDNFETRYLLNDACVKLGKPWVYCGSVSTYGMALLIVPERTPCLRCVFPEPPPPGTSATCDTAGVLGPAVSVAASLAATEGIKWLVDDAAAASGQMVHVDVWELSWHTFRLTRKEDCPCCVERRFPYLEASASSHVTALCGRNAIQITPVAAGKLDLPRVAERLRPAGQVTVNPFLLKLEVDGYLLTLFPDGRAIVEGTTDETVARTLYARYVGA